MAKTKSKEHITVLYEMHSDVKLKNVGVKFLIKQCEVEDYNGGTLRIGKATVEWIPKSAKKKTIEKNIEELIAWFHS